MLDAWQQDDYEGFIVGVKTSIQKTELFFELRPADCVISYSFISPLGRKHHQPKLMCHHLTFQSRIASSNKTNPC